MEEVAPGIRRATLPLPMRPGHVQCYAVRGEAGWTVVDTGLGLPDARERWTDELRSLDGPVTRIFITHFHPDHVGAAADLHELTGAPVVQGALDYAQCELVWGNPHWPDRLVEWFERHGVPQHVTEELVGQGSMYRPFLRYQPDPMLVDAGEQMDGWELVGAAGHADGQLCLLRDGVLLAADHILDPISPTVGLWPASRPDPLGDFLASLERTIELQPRLALPGHGDPIRDPVGRARELIAHHAERLERTWSALTTDPQSSYEVSFPLFGDDLKPASRRFAVAETLSHLERLVRTGRVARHEVGGSLTYTAAE